MKLLLILNHKPYDGSDVAWNALRLAETSLSLGHEVRIFVMNDAVDMTRQGAQSEAAEFDLGHMLMELEGKGASVKLCTTCINRCGIAKGQILNQAWPGSMKDLAQLIAESDKALTF